MSRIAVHPGKVLAEELAALGISPTELARQIEVPANRISQIIHGKRAITGDTALRLAHWFRTEPEFWMSLQTKYDVARAQHQAGDSIAALPTKSVDVRTSPVRRSATRPGTAPVRQSNKATTA